MNTRRKLIIAIGGGALAAPFGSFAQQQGKVWRIGFLGGRSRSTTSKPDIFYDAFVQGLRELGYVEGQNLVVEWRFADGNYERLPSLASELVNLKVDVLVAHATPPGQALQRATNTIPIVVASMNDPVGAGLVESLGRPGKNITGTSNMGNDLGPKQVELLKNLIPALSRIAVLLNPGSVGHAKYYKNVQSAAQRLGIKVLRVDARTSEEIERGLAAMAREHADALIVVPDSFLTGQRASMIADLAVKYRLPSMGPHTEDAVAGLLMSYGPSAVDVYRRAAAYVDKIVKGANPRDLPVEQPMKLESAINLKTAKALGIKIPQSIFLRADKVIE
jgi:putative ABC transport system substrate-binding protein